MTIVQARIGRVVIACTDTSAELAAFDFEIKSDYSRAVEAAVYQDTMAWAWHLVPSLLDQAVRFSLMIEEALPPPIGRRADYLPVYCAERLSAASLCELLTRKRRRAELMTRTRPLHPPLRLVMHAA